MRNLLNSSQKSIGKKIFFWSTNLMLGVIIGIATSRLFTLDSYLAKTLTPLNTSSTKLYEGDETFRRCYLSHVREHYPLFELEGVAYNLEHFPSSFQYRFAKVFEDSLLVGESELLDLVLRLHLTKNSKELKSDAQMYDSFINNLELARATQPPEAADLVSDREFHRFERLEDEFFSRDKRQRIIDDLLTKIKQEGNIRWLYPRPCPPKVETLRDGIVLNSQENKDFDVTYIAAPYCETCAVTWQRLQKLLTRYDQQLAVSVFPTHDNSLVGREITKISYCVARSNPLQFRDFYNQVAALGATLPEEKIKQSHKIYQKILGINGKDLTAYRSCLESRRAREFVKRMFDLAKIVGHSENVTILVNDRHLLFPDQNHSFLHLERALHMAKTIPKGRLDGR